MRGLLLATAIAMALPALVGFTWPGTVEWLCTRGIKQYDAGQFEEAVESFERALEADPDNTTLDYNRGTALHRRGLQDEASEAFDAAVEAGDEQLARDAAYNSGNARLGAGDFVGAAEAYKEALRIDPNDVEAKHNLELALRRQQEEDRQDQQQPDGDAQDQEEPQEDQTEDPRRDESPQDDPGAQDEDDTPQRLDESDDGAPAAQDPEDGELSEAEARRLLQALASEDAEMQKLLRRSPQRRQPVEGEKDW